MICECAELPWDPVERKAGEVLDEVRYLAIRVRRRQGVLFEDGVLTGLKRIALKPEYLRTPAQEAAISDLLLAGHAGPSRAATACAGRPAAGATAGVGGSLGDAAVHGLERSAYGRITAEALGGPGVEEQAHANARIRPPAWLRRQRPRGLTALLDALHGALLRKNRSDPHAATFPSQYSWCKPPRPGLLRTTYSIANADSIACAMDSPQPTSGAADGNPFDASKCREPVCLNWTRTSGCSACAPGGRLPRQS